MSAHISRDVLARIRELTRAIKDLEHEIETRTGLLAPALLALLGCGHLTAAKLVGETWGASRFRSRSAFARHNGSAPIPVWSGNTVRPRLNRGGNRRLNAALHRIAITRLRCPGPGRDYVAKRMAKGDTKLEAIGPSGGLAATRVPPIDAAAAVKPRVCQRWPDCQPRGRRDRPTRTP